MAGRKFDLPDVDLPSSNPPADHSLNPRVEALEGSDEDKVLGGLQFDSKDQMVIDSSIPLSPQWLYTKPSESKMDVRSPSSLSLGAANDPGQKDSWRLDGPEDKKDWRRIASENETSRRWREEERETGLLGARRDRRKVADRRADIIAREPTENRPVLPSSERRHDGGNRTAAGHEAPRRDNNKWSSRWGPEDKDKETRVEKKQDLEKDKEKDDTPQSDNQASTGNIRIAEREASDSRDKWRPRHRMEVHSSSPSSYRAAPGFGPERARVEGSNTGFAVGRGRSSAAGRSLPIGASPPSASYNSESIIGKPAILTASFCYPRGKLLDIYRRQKLDPSFSSMPAEMEESSQTSEVTCTEPLAFVTPYGEELAVLADIWKGKVKSSEVAYNSSRTGRSNKNSSAGLDEYSSEGKCDIQNCLLIKDSALGHENHNNDVLLLLEQDKDGNRQEVEGREAADSLMADTLRGENGINTASSFELKNHVNVHQHNEFVEDRQPILPDDPKSLFSLPSSEKNLGSNGEQSSIPLEELYFCYIDPHGNTQGPFLGADIIMWFEEGYFGTDLPVRLADAVEGTPFQNLGEVLPQLQYKEPYSQSFMEQQPSDMANGISEASLSTMENEGQSLTEPTRTRISDTDNSSKQPPPDEQSFHDLSVQDEEIVFPGRPGSAGIPLLPSSGSLRVPVTVSNSHPSLANEFTNPGLPKQNDTTTLHPFGLFWSELESSHARPPATNDVQRTASFAALSDPAPEKWSNSYRQDSLPSPNLLHDSIVNNRRLPHFEQEHNQVDLAEQLISRQIQQQQSMLSPHALLNESLMQHGPTQNRGHHHHQQLMGHSNPDVEHLLALQMQQQRQHQLQQQQQQQQQQLQLQQQQKQLQERQISQARQVILEQLLHGQVPDPVRANNIIEQVILEQQLLHEMQQQRGPHHPSSRHFHPSMQQEQQRDLFELLSRAQHGQIQNLEQQFLLRQEQIQARQLAEEQQLLESMWPINENEQFLRSLATNQRTNHSSGLSPLDIYQRQQQMQGHEEQQLNHHLDRTLSFQDRLRQGLFDTGAGGPFERSISMPPGGASGMNMDAVMTNAMGGHPLNPHHRPGVADEWMESRIQQLQINKKREEAEAKMVAAAEDRASLWMSDNGMNEDKSRQLLMELLHQKSGHQDALHMNDARSFDRTSDLIYNAGTPNHESTMNSSFPIGSYGSNPRETGDFVTGEDQFVNSGGKRFLLNEAPPQVGFTERSMMRGSSFLDVQDGGIAEHARFGGGAGMEAHITGLSRNSSIGFYDDKVVQKGSFTDEMHMNQLSAAQKGQENVMLRRPPSSRSSSSHEGVSELVSESSLRGKGGLTTIDGINSTNHGSENIVKKDNMRFRRTSSYGDGGEVSEPSFIDMLKSNAKKGPEVAAMQQQQLQGVGGGGSVPSEGMTEGGGQGGKGGGKRKGKKGRQIDPALLGFKVTSNRIMMGEIQRLDD